MEPNPPMVNVLTEVAGTVRGVKSEQLEAATPCRDWNVQTLINHLLQVVQALNLAGTGQVVPDELWKRDLMSDQWAGQFDDGARRAVAAWAAPAAPSGMIAMGSMEMPTGLVVTMLTSDLVIHGWDLARATGQDYHCDNGAAELTYQFLADTGEQGRSMGLYGDLVAVAADAQPLDRALGLSGRDPHWSAG